MSLLDRVRPALRAIRPYHVPPLRVEVKLDANESPYPSDPGLLAAFAEAARSAHFERYPDARANELRALVAEDLGQAPERLVFGNGADESIGLLCQTFAASQQDSGGPGAMVYPGPSFVVYRTAAIAAGLEVIEAPLGPRFEADPAALDAAIARARPNLVFLATPNNPTGTRWDRADVERLIAAHPDVLVVVDEAYAAYARESFLDLVDHFENCAVLRTYSKLGLAGLRLGVLVAQPHVAHEVDKVRPPYNLGILPQLAGALALGPFRATLAAHVEAVIAERERLASALAGMAGVEVFPSAANLLLMRVAAAPEVWRRLVERGVLVRNLDRPGALAGCLRVTVGTPSENARFLDALRGSLVG